MCSGGMIAFQEMVHLIQVWMISQDLLRVMVMLIARPGCTFLQPLCPSSGINWDLTKEIFWKMLIKLRLSYCRSSYNLRAKFFMTLR